MKATLIGLPILGIFAGLVWACILLVAYWVGSLVLGLLGENGDSTDEPGM